MAMRGNLDNWRNFFGFSHFNIFDIIDNAKLVAASDYPQEFNLRKNRIAQTLISPTLTPVVDEEEGLPSPPWDEGDFFATQTTSIDLSEFFDGMDDDGNPQNSENGRPSMSNQNVPKPKQQILSGSYVPAKDKKSEEMKKEQPGINNQIAVVKPNNCLKAESGPARQTKVDARQKVRNETEFQQKLDKTTIQKKSLAAQQDKLKCLDNTAKLEAAKRKLHERYQEVENAKKRRRIKIVELHDIPKQGLDYRDTHMKPPNHNRHWAKGQCIFS